MCVCVCVCVEKIITAPFKSFWDMPFSTERSSQSVQATANITHALMIHTLIGTLSYNKANQYTKAIF